MTHITYPLASMITQFWINKKGEMNSSLSLLGDKKLLSFLCLRTSKTLSLGMFDECKIGYTQRATRCLTHIFPKEELTGCLTVRHREDEFLCTNTLRND